MYKDFMEPMFSVEPSSLLDHLDKVLDEGL